MSYQIHMLFPGGRTHALALSYDDGVEEDLRLIEMLKTYGVKCTFNICSGLFSPEDAPFSIRAKASRSPLKSSAVSDISPLSAFLSSSA